MSKKKIAAIVLFAIQVLAVFGGIITKQFGFDSVPEVIGYFIPTIIGVILLISDRKSSKEKA